MFIDNMPTIAAGLRIGNVAHFQALRLDNRLVKRLILSQIF